MNELLQISIKSSIFDRERQLKISETYVEFDDNDLKTASPTVFLKNDIIGLKYGVEWIKGYRFPIGRIYCIDVLNKDNNIIKIRLKTLYGVRKDLLFDKYAKIVTALHENFISDISADYLKQFSAGKSLFIGGIWLYMEGIILKEDSELITWLNVGIKTYSRYFAVHSISSPEKHKAIEYAFNWEAGILYNVLMEITGRQKSHNTDNLINRI